MHTSLPYRKSRPSSGQCTSRILGLSPITVLNASVQPLVGCLSRIFRNLVGVVSRLRRILTIQSSIEYLVKTLIRFEQGLLQ